MSTPWENNGFMDPTFGGSFNPNGFGSGFKPNVARPLKGNGRPVGQQQPTANPFGDSNPTLANPNSRPVGDPAKRQQRIADRDKRIAMRDPNYAINQLASHPLFQALLSAFQ